MTFTFKDDWNTAENHITTVAGVVTQAEVEMVVSSACAGMSSRDGPARTLLALCGTKSPSATVVKGVHQAENIGLVGAIYHVTISIPLETITKSFHVYFSLTVIDMSAPKNVSRGQWRKKPLAERQYRTFALVALSYTLGGAVQWPELKS